MVEDVWQQKGMPETINKAVAGHYAKVFTEAAQKGYGKNFINIDYDTPDTKAIQHLQNNIYQFSAAKNYSQLKALTQALVNDDGKLRTKKEFFDEAYKINGEHVNTWLNTERNTAVAGGQMAGKWQDLTGNDENAMLEFDAILDGRTTELCAGLNGVVKPAGDPFWSTYYPPNHFNCRSTVRSAYGKTATNNNDIPAVDIPAMFQTNLAQQGLIFPPGSSYYKGLPENTGNTAALRDDMKELAYKKVLNKSVDIEGVGAVHITKSGIDKCLSQKLPANFYDKKNQLVPLANKLLQNAYDTSHEPNKNNRQLKVFKSKIKGLPNYRLVIHEQIIQPGKNGAIGKTRNVLYSITAGD